MRTPLQINGRVNCSNLPHEPRHPSINNEILIAVYDEPMYQYQFQNMDYLLYDPQRSQPNGFLSGG